MECGPHTSVTKKKGVARNSSPQNHLHFKALLMKSGRFTDLDANNKRRIRRKFEIIA